MYMHPLVHDSVRLACADIVTALDNESIGSRVLDREAFTRIALPRIGGFDFASQRVPGQALIEMPEIVPYVSSGVGPRSKDPSDYVVRIFRDQVSAYLKRSFAAPVASCSLVVYARDAYFKDPDVTPAEGARIDAMSPTHVLVAVLAAAGPKSPYPPRTLVRNLAGANHEATTWSADEIRALALASIQYDEAWAPVAD